jgi:hypothetical protein
MVRLAGSFINHKFSLDNHHLQLYSYCPFGHPLAKRAVFPSRKPRAKPAGTTGGFRIRGHDEVPVTVGVFWSWCSPLMLFLSRVTAVQCVEALLKEE